MNSQLIPYTNQTIRGILELFREKRDDVDVHTSGWYHGYYDARKQKWIPAVKTFSLKDGILKEKGKIIGRTNKEYSISSKLYGYWNSTYKLNYDCIDQTNETNNPILIWKEIINSAYYELIIRQARYKDFAHNKRRHIIFHKKQYLEAVEYYKKCKKELNKFIKKYIQNNNVTKQEVLTQIDTPYDFKQIFYLPCEWRWKQRYNNFIHYGRSLLFPKFHLTNEEKETLALKEQYENDYNDISNYTHLTYTFFKKNHNRESYKYMVQGYRNKRDLDIKNTQEKYKKQAKEYIDNFLNDNRNEYSFWYLKEHIKYQYFKYNKQFDRIEFISNLSLNWKDFTEYYKVISICNDNQLCIPDYTYYWKYQLKNRYMGHFYSKRNEDKDGILIEFDSLFVIPESITEFVLDLIRLDKEEELSKTAHIYIQELARIIYTNFVMSKAQFIKKFLSKPVFSPKRTNVRWRKNNQK